MKPGISDEGEEPEIGDQVPPHQRRITCKQAIQRLSHLEDTLLRTGMRGKPQQ